MKTTSFLTYTSAKAINGSTKNLTCRITYPNPAFDGVAKRPVVVLVPGGGFTGISDPNYIAYESYFARMGYVVLRIKDYRVYGNAEYDAQRGLIESFRVDKYGKYSFVSGLSAYAAMQDVNAAIKYLIGSGNNNIYKVDPNKIFLFGESAGAITVQSLALSYKNDEMVDLYKLQRAEPGININSTTINEYKGISYKIAGVIPIAALLLNKNLLQVNDQMPMYMERSNLDVNGAGEIKRMIDTYGIDNISSLEYRQVINTIRNMNMQGTPYPCSYFLITTNTWFDYCWTNNNGYTYNCHCMDPTKGEWGSIIRPSMGLFYRSIINNNPTCPADYYNSQYAYYIYTTSSSNMLRTAALDDELSDQNDESSIQVYPNPTNGTVNISGLDREYPVTVKVFDVLGNEVLTEEVSASSVNEAYALSISALSAGCYYLHIPKQHSTEVVKIIKID